MSSQLVFVDYRNALYQGGFQNQKRQGKGLLLTDNSQLFVGDWHNDLLNGPCLIFLDQTSYVITNFNNGKLHGDYTYHDDKQVVYTAFTNGKQSGSIVEINTELKRAQLLEKKDGVDSPETVSAIRELACEGLSVSDVISQLKGSPADLPTLDSFIGKEFLRDFLNMKALENSTLYEFGKGNFVERVGFELNKRCELVSLGVFMDDELHGIGCQYGVGGHYEKSQRTQGSFRFGLLHGLGMKSIKDSKCVFGHFANGDIRQIEQIDKTANPVDLTTFKSKLHLKSPHFFNSFARPSTLLTYTRPEHIFTKPRQVVQANQQGKQDEIHRTPAVALKNSRATQPTAAPKTEPQYKTAATRLNQQSLASSRHKSPSPPKQDRGLNESKRIQLTRQIHQVRSPIMVTDKSSAGIQQPNFMTPRSSANQAETLAQPLNPEGELSPANHVLNRMEDPKSQLEQNIREYQTLARMIKTAKHEQQLQRQYQLNRRFH